MTRRESREIAFALLFEWSFHGENVDEMIENAGLAREAVVDSFARELTEKTIANREEIDGLIEQYSQGWKLGRISRVTLATLRLSFCELTRFGDIPVGATINEAVELVKKYGTEDEAAYLNGILGTFERVRKGFAPEPAKPVKEETREEQQAGQQPVAEPVQNEYNKQPPGAGDVELVEDIVIEVE